MYSSKKMPSVKISPDSSTKRREAPAKPKSKLKFHLRRQGAEWNIGGDSPVRSHVRNGHVGHSISPNMKKIQKESKMKSKVSSKLSKGGDAYKKRVKKAVDKFKSLVSSKKAVAPV